MSAINNVFDGRGRGAPMEADPGDGHDRRSDGCDRQHAKTTPGVSCPICEAQKAVDGWRQIGEVEVLRLRVYPLDAELPQEAPGATWVCVEAGRYPVYRRDDVVQWLMSGRINDRSQKIGDGLYALHDGDKPTGLTVQFPSRVFGLADFRKLLVDVDVAEPRIRFHLTEQVDA